MSALFEMLGVNTDFMLCAASEDGSAAAAQAAAQDQHWAQSQEARAARERGDAKRFGTRQDVFGRAPAMWVEASAQQNTREYMEDTHDLFKNIGGDENITAFGVFDGHGGERASKFCSRKMLPTLAANMATPKQRSNAEEAVHKSMLDTAAAFDKLAGIGKWVDGTTAVVVIVHQMRLICGNIGDSRAVLGRRAFSECGDDTVAVYPTATSPPSSGSASAMVGGSKRRLSRRKSSTDVRSRSPMSGRSRSRSPSTSGRPSSPGPDGRPSAPARSNSLPASMQRRSGTVSFVQAVPLSEDHKPSSPTEWTRIRLAGGIVAKSRAEYESGAARGRSPPPTNKERPTSPPSSSSSFARSVSSFFGFNSGPPTPTAAEARWAQLPDRCYPGGLSVSRTIGDVTIKASAPGVVSATPEVRAVTLSPEKDLFVIVASDGVWDVLTSEEACRLVCVARADGEDGAAEVVSEAIRRGSRDNCTAMVVHFSWVPPSKDLSRPVGNLKRTASGQVRFANQPELAHDQP